MIDLPDAPDLPGIDDAPADAANDELPDVLRIFDEDGTLHFSHLKKLALSGVKYLHAVNTPMLPSRAMLIGTVTHFLILGQRPGAKLIVRYPGERRSGKEWERFLYDHPPDRFEVATAPEWEEAEVMVEAVRRSPVAQRRLVGARYEVPLEWVENGIRCSTSGIDIIPVDGGIGDLKSTQSTHPDTFKKQAWKMLYPQQLAFYRRGARAHGLDVSKLFILGVENHPASEVVELLLTSSMIDMADRSISIWLEDLRRNMLAISEPRSIYDWPGYAEAPVQLDVPPWQREGAAEDDAEEEAA